MAKRRSRRTRVKLDSNAEQFARAGNPWTGDRELAERRAAKKVSLFSEVRKIATCGENRKECEVFKDLQAIARMRAMRKPAPPPAPSAFVAPRRVAPGEAKPEPTSYAPPKPLVDSGQVRASRVSHWRTLRKEWAKSLKRAEETGNADAAKRAKARLVSIDTELEILGCAV